METIHFLDFVMWAVIAILWWLFMRFITNDTISEAMEPSMIIVTIIILIVYTIIYIIYFVGMDYNWIDIFMSIKEYFSTTQFTL